MSKCRLTYFNSRGGAELARLVLKCKGIEFEDERLEGDAWTQRKPDTPLGALPVLKIGDKEYCQSAAIARYLAKENGLMGANNLEALRIEEMMEMFAEMLNRELIKIYMEKDDDKKKELVKTFSEGSLQKYLDFVEKRLKEIKEGKAFLIGDKLSLGDLVIIDGLTMIGAFKIDPFKDRTLLKAHFDRVGAIPEIAKWVKERPATNF
ncbi:glutathione S-transferase 1-like [Mercenaria mercenaria]|uniref:glutathione S-transferase 1-like n=1 Tax=Mercenaria mercenaria TaxID=6596 RepID=UPI00234F8D5C|nr:glutathione S-transferase 1-like [Mercenaria mercenaria]